MKLPGAWRVVLVVEDDSDGRAIQAMLKGMGFEGEVDWLPANGIGNIKRNGDKLLRLALDRIANDRGCVAVVIDGDACDLHRDEPHRSIRAHCRAARVPLIVAREALEAWLLADRGVCKWLGRRPQNADHLNTPKRSMEDAFRRKTGREYRKRRARVEVARRVDGTAVERSPSLQKAVGHLDRSICAPRRRG